jgi:hypothetical protein
MGSNSSKFHRNTEDGVALIVAAATRDGVVPANFAPILTQGPNKGEGSIADIHFEDHSSAENEAAGRKCSGPDGACSEAGSIKGGASANFKAAIGTGAGALRDVAGDAKRRSCVIGECAAQLVPDVRNDRASDPSLLAVGTSAVDPIGPAEGGADEASG